MFVADPSNRRIIRMRYNWQTTALEWQGTISNIDLRLPTDIELHNGGTFLNDADDYFWVVDGYRIRRFTLDGVLHNTYGTCGPGGQGEFYGVKAVACGRSNFLSSPYEPYANNNYIYVADCGHKRIVWLEKDASGENITWKGEVASSKYIWDIEADNFGQIWAIDADSMTVTKYTYDLFPLCTYSSPGVGDNKVYRPMDILNIGGYLGCGNVGITESWTDSTGLQYFGIGTDILDFSIQNSSDDHFHYIYYTLVDPSRVKIQIQGFNKSVTKDLYHGATMSGPCFHVWDGTNNAGVQADSGYYCIMVWDTCSYSSSETGLPMNELSFGQWFYHAKNLNPSYLPGDANADGNVDIGDAVYLINYVFKGGPEPIPVMCVGDVNDDSAVNVGDAVYMINYVFKGGPAPNNGCD